jgi:nicotinamidase-related amidase
MGGELRYGRLSTRTVHLCVDMQTMFAERTDWHVPWMERVLPTVVRLSRAQAERTPIITPIRERISFVTP